MVRISVGHRSGSVLGSIGKLSLLAAMSWLAATAGFARPAAAAEALMWHSDYSQARKAAIDSEKFLCLVFEDGPKTSSGKAKSSGKDIWSQLAQDADLRESADFHVMARLPRDTTIQLNGKPTTLLKHAAFQEMRGKSGVAILDYTDSDSPHFGRVVSVYPRRVVPKQHFRELLNLPSGSLSQRTLILAVRMHGERPQSTEGRFHPVLANEAKQHSQHQARINNQGHHNFGSRFHRINARLTGGLMVQEVVAESWPGQGMFEAAVECVSSWRQSSGHWGAVRARHPVFGYDMKRGGNGVWYATGLFAHH